MISDQIDAARAVVVVWTPASVESRWVRGEAGVLGLPVDDVAEEEEEEAAVAAGGSSKSFGTMVGMEDRREDKAGDRRGDADMGVFQDIKSQGIGII